MTDQSLQIVNVRIENVLGIKRASFEPPSPTGASILHGDNGEGKTSLLEAIRAGFHGLPAELIRRGQSEGEVLLRLAGPQSAYTIKRRRTASGQKLEVLDGDGQKVPRPSAWLNGILGDFSLDPGAFALADGQQQVRLFCEAFPVVLAGEGVIEMAEKHHIVVEGRNGFLVLRELEEAMMEERQAIGRAKRDAEAVADEVEPTNVALERRPNELQAAGQALVDSQVKLGAVATENEARDARNDNRKAKAKALATAEMAEPEHHRRVVEETERIEAEISRLQARKLEILNDLNEVTPGYRANVGALQRELHELGDFETPTTTEEAEASMLKAQEALNAEKAHDSRCDAIEKWREKREAADAYATEWREAGEYIKKTVRGSWLRGLWRQVPDMIPGLELGQDPKGRACLVIDEGEGVKVELASVNTAKKIQVGVRIAAALNADYPVKLLAVDDAEHLTRKNRDELARAAEEAGFQVLMLVACDPEDVPPGGLMMTDGVVVEQK